jgi:hypothetical protein
MIASMGRTWNLIHSGTRASILISVMLILVGSIRAKEHSETKNTMLNYQVFFLFSRMRQENYTIKVICKTSRWLTMVATIR